MTGNKQLETGPIAVRGILYLDAPGALLCVRAGALHLRIVDGQEHRLPPATRTLIAAAPGFAVTSAAIKLCLSSNIELLLSDDSATFISLFSPTPLTNASRSALKLRARQHACAASAAESTRIARAIVAAKVRAEGHARHDKLAFLTALRAARTTDDVRHIEAQAAQVWWKQWAGFELRFKGVGIPVAWRTFHSRYIGRRQGKLGELPAQFTARNAVHPMQAMQNYAIAVLAARITRVVIARGLDPCFGFLHDGRKPGRLSLCWDMAELWRPALVCAVFATAVLACCTSRT